MKSRGLAVVAILLLCLTLSACSIYPEETTSSASVKLIFNTPETKKTDGATAVQVVNNSKVLVDYNYYPVGLYSYQEELGVALCPKLKKLFNTYENINTVTIVGYGPYVSYGEVTWKPMLTMTINRNAFTKANKTFFESKNLFKIATDVRVFREDALWKTE